MLSGLKTRVLAIINKATATTFLRRATPEQRFNRVAPIYPAETREGRKISRKIWQLFKSYDRGWGAPKLSGDKYLRQVSNVYGVPFAFVVMWNFEGSLSDRIEYWNKARRMREPNASRNCKEKAQDFNQPFNLHERNILETGTL